MTLAWRWWLNYNKCRDNQEQNSLAEVGPNSQSNTLLDFGAGITLTKSKRALHKGLAFLTCSVNSLVYSGAHLPFSAACATKNVGASKGCQARNILTMTLGASKTLIPGQTKPASHSHQPWRWPWAEQEHCFSLWEPCIKIYLWQQYRLHIIRNKIFLLRSKVDSFWVLAYKF